MGNPERVRTWGEFWDSSLIRQRHAPKARKDVAAPAWETVTRLGHVRATILLAQSFFAQVAAPTRPMLRRRSGLGMRMAGLSDLPVAIIGAGPFGLSVAAHLRSSGVAFRIFGTPMHRWRAQIPMGMFLNSEWDASEPCRSSQALHAAAILRGGRSILRKRSSSARHLHQIRAVISASSGSHG